jgi:hypothetical protein
MSIITSALPDIIAPITFINLSVSSVDSTQDQIELGTTHNFITGDYVYVTYSAGGTNVAGINLYTGLFVISVTASTIKLATTRSNALAGVAIDITSTTSLTGTFSFYKYAVGVPLSQLSRFPSYAKAAYSLNSSIPVEISFTVPITSSTDTINPLLPITGFASSIMAAIGIGTDILLFGGWFAPTDRFFAYYVNNSSGAVGGPMSFNTKQTTYWKMVINSQRRVELWGGSSSLSSVALIYTFNVLPPNTALSLGVGINFNLVSIIDWRIKYL